MTYGATNLKDVASRPCPENELLLELEPKTPGSGAFKAREPMVTQEQLQAMDAALTAKKATLGYRDLSDHFALEQQQHRGGGL
jgi:hypothetical protein